MAIIGIGIVIVIVIVIVILIHPAYHPLTEPDHAVFYYRGA